MGLKHASELSQQAWNKSYVDLTTLKYILMTLVPFAIHGNNNKFYLSRYCLVLKQIVSLLTPSNLHELSKNQLAWILVDATGLKPWKKRISGILEQEPSCNIKVICCFLGAVNTFQLIWPKQVHLLTPLSNESCKMLLYWTPDMDKAFMIMKLSWLPIFLWRTSIFNHNIPFHVYSNVSNYQMGATIIQQKWPVAY